MFNPLILYYIAIQDYEAAVKLDPNNEQLKPDIIQIKTLTSNASSQ